MMMEKGDVVLVDYTGKDLTTNAVFDTTDAEKAREAHTFDERIIYKPVPIVLGQHEMLASLETEMESMKVGETRKIVLPPAKGFGDRLAENIRVSALKDFRDNKMVPFPGMRIEANGVQGRVQSVSGGRVRIDFNHPLAGKTLEYEISIRKKFETLQEQSSALFDKFFPIVTDAEKKVSVKDGEVEVELPEKALDSKHLELLKKIFAKVLTEQLKGVKNVRFVETIASKKPQEKKDNEDGLKTAKEQVPKVSKTSSSEPTKTAAKAATPETQRNAHSGGHLKAIDDLRGQKKGFQASK